MKNFNPIHKIQDLRYFGVFEDVKPMKSEGSTNTFMLERTLIRLIKSGTY